MSNLSERSNKFTMILLSLLLLLTLMFSLLIPPLKVLAYSDSLSNVEYDGLPTEFKYKWSDCVTELTYLIGAKVINSADFDPFTPAREVWNRIDIATRLDFINLLNSDFFDDGWNRCVSCPYGAFDKSSAKLLEFYTELIEQYSVPDQVYVSLDHHGDYLGFTSDTLFDFTIPNISNPGDIVYIDLGSNSFLKIESMTNIDAYARYPEFASKILKYNCYALTLLNSDGLSWVTLVQDSWASRSVVGGSYQSVDYGDHTSTFTTTSRARFVDGNKQLYLSGYNFYFNGVYYKASNVSGRYGLYDSSSSSFYQGLTFDSYNALYLWVFTQFNLKIDLKTVGSNIVPAFVEAARFVVNGVQFPSDEDVEHNLNTISTYKDDNNNLTFIFSTNFDDLNTLHDNGIPSFFKIPSSLVPVYPSDLPSVIDSPDLWKKKFPFCLAFDLSNLINIFGAVGVAPEFDFLLFPKNNGFFPLENDITIHFDFDDFVIFVNTLRFFLGFGFVLFLILNTNKFIK